MILTIALLMPPEVRLNFSGQTLYTYRIAWLALLPFVVIKLLRGAFQFRLNDFFVVAGGLWITISFTAIYGWAIGVPSGIATTFDIVLPYLIARMAIRDFRDLRRFLIVIAPLVIILALLLPVESYTGNRFIRNAATAVFGGLGGSEFGVSSTFIIANDMRYGFLRAMGPFSHPILAGVFFCSLLPLYYFSGLRGWPRALGFAAGFGSIFTLSSGASLGIFVFFVLALYDFLIRKVVFLNWPIFISAVSALMVALHLITQNGIVAVLIRFTMNPQTGIYRMLIWEYGMKSVAKYPFFGIGYNKFEALAWMGDSIDTFWLHLAVRSGLPTALFLLFAALWAIFCMCRMVSQASEPDRTTLIGLAITLTIVALVGFTVSFFGGLLTWFAILLGVSTTFGHFRPSSMPRRLNPIGQMKA